MTLLRSGGRKRTLLLLLLSCSVLGSGTDTDKDIRVAETVDKLVLVCSMDPSNVLQRHVRVTVYTPPFGLFRHRQSPQGP